MYKVMLVEDEPPILEMLKDMIDAGDNGFEVAVTAYNGRAALKLLEENLPDVLITDIRIPFIDGLELIEKVKKLYPKVICVILTGYSDFEYARKALRFQAFDYMLKPIQHEQLENLLHNLARILNQENKCKEHDYIRAIVTFQNLPQEEAVPINYPYYYVILAYAGSLANQIYDFVSPGKGYWAEADTRLEAYLDSVPCHSWYFTGNHANERIIILGAQYNTDEWIKEMCRGLIEKLKPAFLPVNIISGHAVQDINALGATIKKLMKQLSVSVIFGQSRIFFEDDKSTDSSLIGQETEKQLLTLLQQKDFNAFQNVLKVVLNNWERAHCTQISLQSRLNHFFNLYIQNHPLSDFKIDANEIVINSTDYEDLYDNICCLFQEMYEIRDGAYSDNSTARQVVERIEEYLNDNYFKNISIKDLYDMFGYNEVYISSLYKNIKGISPGKHITRLRINKAMEILTDNPNILLKTVAEMVGYDDSLYFSRVFKELEGTSPSEYAKKIRGK